MDIVGDLDVLNIYKEFDCVKIAANVYKDGEIVGERSFAKLNRAENGHVRGRVQGLDALLYPDTDSRSGRSPRFGRPSKANHRRKRFTSLDEKSTMENEIHSCMTL